jgi:hypothetical protein
MKYCKTCNRFLEDDKFYSYFQSICKCCYLEKRRNKYHTDEQFRESYIAKAKQQRDTPERREYMRKYYQENKEIIKHNYILWQKNNPEKYKESKKKWQRNNPEKYKESIKKWQRNNPEKHKESIKKWQRNNPDKLKKYREKWLKNNPNAKKRMNERKKKYRKEKMKNDPSYRHKVNARKASRKRKKGFFPLVSNVFPDDINVDFHHVHPNLPFVFPLPRELHLSVNGVLDDHMESGNSWVEFFFDINVDELLGIDL